MFLDLIPSAFAQGAAAAKTAAPKTVAEATQSVGGFATYFINNIDNWLIGLGVIILSFIASKMLSGTIRDKIIRARGEDVSENALVLIEKVTKFVIVLIGITIALAVNGINFTAVIGAISLGIGFALKDIVANFISSLVMLAQNRIRIGDLVQIADQIGTILSIDTRVTVLQSLDGTEVVIPNQTVLNSTVISFTANPFRRIELDVGVDFKTNLPTVTSLIRGVVEKDQDIVPKPLPVVLIDTFGESSINIKVYFWIESTKNWLQIKSNLAHRIKKAFDEVGINIPFPIRTLKIDEDDRAFLKTMDSLRKGQIPEKKQIPSQEAISAAAKNTEKEPIVPYSPFKPIPVIAEPVPAVAPASSISAAINPHIKDDPSIPPPTAMPGQN